MSEKWANARHVAPELPLDFPRCGRLLMRTQAERVGRPIITPAKEDRALSER
jgi:hypothetical protein